MLARTHARMHVRTRSLALARARARALAHSIAPVGRRALEGSEGPLWKGAGLPAGHLGQRQ
eukprot:15459871-Alexandrium_andersonii.AAC.1